MIIGVGIDIVEIDRVAALIDRYGDRFLNKIFLPDEIAYCRRHRRFAQHFAVRIAAKEAASKALGTGWHNGVHWKLVEVRRIPPGQPQIVLHGRAAQLARHQGVNSIVLSLTHGENLAIAEVIMQRVETEDSTSTVHEVPS